VFFFLSIVVVYTHTMMECIVTCTNFWLFLFFFSSSLLCGGLASDSSISEKQNKRAATKGYAPGNYYKDERHFIDPHYLYIHIKLHCVRKSFPDYNIKSSPSKIEYDIILPRRSEQDSTLQCSAVKRRHWATATIDDMTTREPYQNRQADREGVKQI